MRKSEGSVHRCEKKKTEGSYQIIKEEKYRFSVCTSFQLHGLWPSLWRVGCKCSKRKQLHRKDYVRALKDCIQAATLNKLYRTADKTQWGKSGGQSWRVGRSKKKEICLHNMLKLVLFPTYPPTIPQLTAILTSIPNPALPPLHSLNWHCPGK